MVRRVALLAGEFPAPYRPVSRGELAGLALRARESQGPCLGLAAERRQLAWLLRTYGRIQRPVTWSSCDCRSPQVHLGLGGRVGVRDLGPGEVVAREAGLQGRGLMALVEPDLVLWSGRSWLQAGARLEIPLQQDGRDVDPALHFAGWPEPTGRAALGRTRTGSVARVAVPMAVLGMGLGNWSLAAGLMPAEVGVGLDGGGLTLAAQAGSVPQLVVRRTRPLRWSGLLSWFDPEHVLLRVGVTSEQTIRYETPAGRRWHRANPLLTQWLLTWDHRSWWRTTVCGTALSASRQGQALWPDLIQVNFPLLDATWNEVDYGPVTDRMVSLIMEARWRRAPWSLLPRAAGRVWWEYAGEDFRPHDQLPLLPEISAPANLAGVELVDHRWDLAVEYLLTRHSRVLWYGNSGFSDGYTHRGLLLGHELGGGAEAWTGLVRWRTRAGTDELELRGRSARWLAGNRVPEDAHRREIDLSWRRLAGCGGWSAGVGWVEESAGDVTERWWRGRLERRF